MREREVLLSVKENPKTSDKLTASQEMKVDLTSVTRQRRDRERGRVVASWRNICFSIIKISKYLRKLD